MVHKSVLYASLLFGVVGWNTILPGLDYPGHLSNTREQEFSPITVLDDEQRNVTADDLPEPVCAAVVAELAGVSNDGATPDGVTVDEHVVRVDDFREDAADSPGMTYHVSLSVGSVAGVSGGHYFQDSNGNRITSQWNPMDLTWNDVPTAVREVIADRVDFQLLDSN